MATKRILGHIFVILIIGRTSSCCNPDWFANNGSCYQVSQIQHDYTLARRYCQILNADLAHVGSIEALKFVNTLKNFDGKETYWLKEDSSVATAAPTVIGSCRYARMLSIESGPCDEHKFFVCQTADENTELECPASWSQYDTSCYKAVMVQVSYVDAAQKCALLKGQLAVFDTEEKERNAQAVVLGRNQTFYVGANRNYSHSGGIAWSSGIEFNPSCGEICRRQYTNDSLPRDCVVLSSTPQHPTVFMWFNVNCGTKTNLLCQRPAGIRSTPPPPTEPPTTPLPFVCPPGHNWKAHEASGFCFWETTYETDRLNWYQARAFCQSYGGDLASYEDVAQENYGLGSAKGHYRGLWFGLKRGEDDVFRWSDGSPLHYVNWNVFEPKLGSRTKFCVRHGALDAKWELDYCGVRRWFVCKAPKVQVQVIPDRSIPKKVRCNVTDVSVFHTQWYLYEDYCYMAHEDAKYTWDTAETFCQDNGAHLASVHSFNETDFMLFITSISPDSNFWIGLSSKDIDSPLEWSDGTPVDFENELSNATTSTGLVDTCVSFMKTDGAWQVEHCNRLLSVMCKRSTHSPRTEFSTSPPTPEPVGNCPSGWYPNGEKCYMLKGNRIHDPWALATSSCEDIQASLVSVHSQSEQDFLTDLVCELGGDVWIGLKTFDRGTLFKWTDNSRVDYTYWDAHQPRYSSKDGDGDWPSFYEREMCTKMLYETDSIGKWSIAPCRHPNAFICERPKDLNIVEPSMKPFICPNIAGWLKLGSTCYGLFENPGEEASWLDAQSKCRHYDANLVSFKNAGVSNFLKRRFARKKDYYWTAVREKSINKYELVTGKIMSYSNWMPGQPRPLSPFAAMDNCVASNTNGSWIVKSCQEKHPFVCEWTPEQHENVHVISSSRCPSNSNSSNWINLKGPACYLFTRENRLTWNEAVTFCLLRGGSLASFHSEEEMKSVRSYLHSVGEILSFVYIGLIRRTDGGYAWVDHTPVDFTWWESGEDHYGSRRRPCVKMETVTGKWRHGSCNTPELFICSAPKVNTKEKKAAEEDPTEEEEIATKLTAGGIAGIVICILVILAVAGMVTYHICHSSKIRLTLLEQETTE